MKELVSVVIPILNPEIDPTEERILHHCLETLHQYPLIFITFEGADLSIVKEHNEDIDVIYFPKKYFQSRDHLASLFLMEDFYDRFNWCDFLLIHELNSWVVRDELYYWCKQGYDYLTAAPYFDNPGKISDHILKRLSGLTTDEKILFGNGYTDNGLYLCRIERMTKTLQNKRKEAYQYRHEVRLQHADSVFWDLEANRFWPQLRKPTHIVRNHFARNVMRIGNSDALPFALTGICRSNIRDLPYFNTKPEAD
ncbi:DUF5672 family protein [Dyadobacter aurulentus]|uniref:DUF5672 family protein n=1 Tax=Dyadobacter sp. UC 10 TaxID=2605428 RepID=UPI0011F15B48|nr:DUF5672 family protein [Dyadobacter sp. UC 10]KAA0991601.1 hypothetical protein FXO21_16210 [Dyadobacter sp. UC 10]